MIEKLIKTLELMNKLKGFKSFKIEFNPDEVRDLFFELIELQNNLNFMIDKNDEKQDRIDKAMEFLNNSQLYGIMGSGKNFYSTIMKEVRDILTDGDEK